MHDFKIWILIIWICLYFYCVQNPLKDWHGITRQDNLIGDMTWNSSSKHDCIAWAWASLHSSQIPIVPSSSQCSPVLIQKLECMVPQVLGHLASSLLDICKYLQVRTQLNSFHIDVCSDHSLDNLLILPAYFKTQVMNFVRINNDEHFYL